MRTADRITTSAGKLVRHFAHYSESALSRPVIVTRSGWPRNVLFSVAECERLKHRDQRAFLPMGSIRDSRHECQLAADRQHRRGINFADAWTAFRPPDREDLVHHDMGKHAQSGGR